MIRSSDRSAPKGCYHTASAISRHWLTVNATSKPPHLGAGRAYLEHVTAAKFCEEGGHGLEVGEAESLSDRYELGLI